MKNVLKYVASAAILAVFVMAGQASAQTVLRSSSCSEVMGGNRLTYDCNFNAKNYTVGQELTFHVGYVCTGACGPVMSFNLAQPGFTPSTVSGRMTGGEATDDGANLTFVFDSLAKGTGNAHFTMMVNMDDGTGNWKPVACKVKVHLGD